AVVNGDGGGGAPWAKELVLGSVWGGSTVGVGPVNRTVTRGSTDGSVHAGAVGGRSAAVGGVARSTPVTMAGGRKDGSTGSACQAGASAGATASDSVPPMERTTTLGVSVNGMAGTVP